MPDIPAIISQWAAPATIIAAVGLLGMCVDSGFDRTEQRFAAQDARIEGRFSVLETRIAETNQRIDQAFQVTRAARQELEEVREDLGVIQLMLGENGPREEPEPESLPAPENGGGEPQTMPFEPEQRLDSPAELQPTPYTPAQ